MKRTAARFPPRPKAGGKRGKEVKLIANLFKLMFNSERPLRKYHVMVIPPPKEQTSDRQAGDVEEPTTSSAAASIANKATDTEVTKKIPCHIRRQLVASALEKWAKNSGDKKLNQIANKYVYDGIATIYTIVNLFGEHEINNNNWYETVIRHEEMSITDKDMQITCRDYSVKVGYKQKEGTIVDLKLLQAYCSGQALAIEDIQPGLQALNILVNYNMASSGQYVCVGNNMYNPRGEQDFYLGNGLRMNNGFYLSTRPTKCGMVLNVANSSTAFYEESSLVDLFRKRVSTKKRLGPRAPLIDTREAINIAKGDQSIWEMFEKDIKQKQIEARHKGYAGSNGTTHYRKYRILGLNKTSPIRQKFTLIDKATNTSKEVTVAQYFKDTYGVNLKYPDLNCVKAGSPGKSIDLPMEVCWLVDKQVCRRKLDPKETSEFIKESATKPEIHFKKIERNATYIRESGREIYKTFGLSISTEPISVKGRELVPAGLKGNIKISPSDGVYNIRNARFFRPVSVVKWMLAFCIPAYPDRDIPEGKHLEFCEKFANLYMNGAATLGIKIGRPIIKDIGSKLWSDESFWREKFFPVLEQQLYQYVLIVLPDQAPDWLYQTIKFAEANSAIKLKGKFVKTQCLKHVNFKKGSGVSFNGRPDQSLMTNLWLKANEKLGGSNFTLQASNTPGMFDRNNLYVGIDVSHPAPGDALCRSVVAAVGMWDITEKVGYHTVLKVQETRNETSAQQITIEHVDKAAEMLAAIVESYKATKRSYPNHILILRDGVSEGQFNIVHNLELNKILIYAEKLSNKPKVTYVVVQKRHKIRFKLAQRSPTDRDDNIHPGTVVDQDVIHPTDHDFYLAPHKAIQGTSRPAHYYALHDEKNYSQDDLQEISHALCYLSPRCNRAISIPAPVYLADLAAERGRNLVIAWASRVTCKKKGSRENVTDLNNFFGNLPSEYLNELFYN